MRWLLLFLLFSSASGQEVCKHCPVGTELDSQFPEAPSVHPRIFNRTFWFAEGIHAAAISFDSYETISHEGPCALEGSNGFPEYVGGKELAVEGIAEFGASFLGTVLLKYVGPPKHFRWTPYLIPTYGTALHLRGGIQWYSRCH